MEENIIMDNKFSIYRKVNVKLTEEDILMLSPLQLAYVGDAVYELLVRTYLLEKKLSVNELHIATTKYVKAGSQSYIVHNLKDILTEKEKKLVKKGRNCKSNSSPKNADMIDYRYATGFEALIGWLYLNNKEDRIYELFEEIIKI